jgi:F-type H+-transporting ATPase subunit delta
MISPVATRYAKALYDLASEQKLEEKVLNELREMSRAFQVSPEEFSALTAPTLRASDRSAIVEKLLESRGYSDLFKNFLHLLMVKGRLEIFCEVTEAYQAESDLKHGVVRGTVKSPHPLGPEQRARLEETVSRVTNKKTILEYKEAPELIGGLVAQVGSYTFDDSLDTQLRLLYENLSKGAN